MCLSRSPPRSLFLSLSSQRIQAVNTNAESSLERFKAYAVFQEIKKKLEEVSSLLCVICFSYQLLLHPLK
jgi:hypothetical protein